HLVGSIAAAACKITGGDDPKLADALDPAGACERDAIVPGHAEVEECRAGDRTVRAGFVAERCGGRDLLLWAQREFVQLLWQQPRPRRCVAAGRECLGAAGEQRALA